ncbi:MAG: pantoate--beta-alanine ligase [Anaerolineae bacterium]
MKQISTTAEMHAVRRSLSGTVGLAPTMGYLHAGHVALVTRARAENEHVIATIFVNPTQFGPNEDLTAYPRDFPRDFALLAEAGCDIVFTPSPDAIYPPGFQTYVTVEEVAQPLEGARRPGHFRGVATVVAKLFNLTRPTRAYFGQKDAQQVRVIQTMALDLNFDLEIVVCPTVREPDGLAMSSRNAYLTPEQRRAAPALYRALTAGQEVWNHGERDPERLRGRMAEVLAAEPLALVEYISAADARSLAELHESASGNVLLSLAVRIGRTRLIDNLVL